MLISASDGQAILALAGIIVTLVTLLGWVIKWALGRLEKIQDKDDEH